MHSSPYRVTQHPGFAPPVHSDGKEDDITLHLCLEVKSEETKEALLADAAADTPKSAGTENEDAKLNHLIQHMHRQCVENQWANTAAMILIMSSAHVNLSILAFASHAWIQGIVGLLLVILYLALFIAQHMDLNITPAIMPVSRIFSDLSQWRAVPMPESVATQTNHWIVFRELTIRREWRIFTAFMNVQMCLVGLCGGLLGNGVRENAFVLMPAGRESVLSISLAWSMLFVAYAMYSVCHLRHVIGQIDANLFQQIVNT